jgi:hypothetical protein
MQCHHKKLNGQCCRAHALPGKTCCTFHDPSLARRREAGRKQGGVNRTSKLGGKVAATLPPDTPDLPLSNPTEVVAALAQIFNQVRRGQLGVSVGNCLAIIATAILKAQEGDGVLPRLEALEATKRQQESKRRVLA